MSRIYKKVVSQWDTDLHRYVTDYSQSIWREVHDLIFDMCCGASGQQTQIEQSQSNLYNTLTQQAQQVFGNASSIFNDLQQTFAPILAAGPNQEGFSAAEKANLNDEIINSTGESYNKAANAVNSQIASEGGGDVPIINSQDTQVRGALAQSAASQEAGEREQVLENSYATGRQNFMNAASALSGATNVFNPSSTMDNSATGAGSAAANTANEIAQENNSWLNATIGALGGIAGSAAKGYFEK
jgi:hypothetical protein